MADLTHHSELLLLALVVAWWIVLRLSRTHGALLWAAGQAAGRWARHSRPLRVGSQATLAVITVLGLTVTVPARSDPDGWQAAHLFFMPRASWERDQDIGMLHPASWYGDQEQGRATGEPDRDRPQAVAGRPALADADALSPLMRLGILPPPPRRDYVHSAPPLVVLAVAAVPKAAPAGSVAVAVTHPTVGPAPVIKPLLPAGIPGIWSPAAFHFSPNALITISGADHSSAAATDGNPVALPLAGPQPAALWALLLSLAVPLYRSRRPTPPVPPPRAW
ncbi:MAG: hypothetical protein M3Z04_20995 [Chloroflexota bacterium]|nr:hypothetical protein [Chloroflexota bacterium]